MTTRKTRMVRFAAAVVAAHAASAGAEPTTIREFGAPGALVGDACAVGGDLDGDGVPDVLAEKLDFVRAFSGKTGAVIRDFVGVSAPFGFGRAVAFSPDVDGDHVPDVLVGAPGSGISSGPPGMVILFSGATGVEIARGSGTLNQSYFGRVVLSIGDVTGDGIPDFMGGGGGVSNNAPGEFRAFSGADGSPIAKLSRAGIGTENLGISIAALGDVTGDGVPDIAVGASGANRPAPPAPFVPRGRVDVYSGADGSIVKQMNGKALNFGYRIADAGDLDGDGRRDLAVAGNGFLEVAVYSSRTWKAIRHYPAPTGTGHDYFGDGLAAGVDLNHDGFPDLVVGSDENIGGTLYVFSGAPLAPLPIFQVIGTSTEFITLHPALAPDFDGDGVGDLLSGGWFTTGGVRIIGVVPALPPKFSFAVALTRAQAQIPSNTRGVFQVRVGGGVQTVAVGCSGLPAGGGTYTIHLEDGPGVGTYAQVGDFAATPSGGSAYRITGQATPPAQLGITTLAQLAGRRAEVRDPAGVVILVAVIPYPGTLPAITRKAPLIKAPAATLPSPSGLATSKYVPAKGASVFTITVKGVPRGTPLALEVETAVGSGVFVSGGAFVKTTFSRDTGKGQPLPGGASTLADLSGRAVRVTSGADDVVVGLLP